MLFFLMNLRENNMINLVMQPSLEMVLVEAEGLISLALISLIFLVIFLVEDLALTLVVADRLIGVVKEEIL